MILIHDRFGSTHSLSPNFSILVEPYEDGQQYAVGLDLYLPDRALIPLVLADESDCHSIAQWLWQLLSEGHTVVNLNHCPFGKPNEYE